MAKSPSTAAVTATDTGSKAAGTNRSRRLRRYAPAVALTALALTVSLPGRADASVLQLLP